MINNRRVTVIAAVGVNNVIGDGNEMPWYIREDLRHFSETTSGHTVIMGRKTLDSIGGDPLKKRVNIAISSSGPDLEEKDVPTHLEGARLFHVNSIENAIEAVIQHSVPDNEVFVIGGGMIYEAFMNLPACVDRLLISHVLTAPYGSVEFPPISKGEWKATSTKHYRDASIPFAVIEYERYIKLPG